MPISNPTKWQEWVECNTDPYGKACVDVARAAMEILDEQPQSTVDPHALICAADKRAKAGGITGFMAGCVAHMISVCHSRGEEFRQAWNKDYPVEVQVKERAQEGNGR